MKIRKEENVIVVEGRCEIRHDIIVTGKSWSFGLNVERDNDLWKINSRYCIIHCPDSFLVWDNEKKESPKYVYTCDTFEEAID